MQQIKIKPHDLNRLMKGKKRETTCPRRAGRALQQEKGVGSSQLHLSPHAIYCKSIERMMEGQGGGCSFRKAEKPVAVAIQALEAGSCFRSPESFCFL